MQPTPSNQLPANAPAQADSWEAILGVSKPSCCNLKAACCSVAVPSCSPTELVAQAAQGDSTARDFLSVFEAHPSHQAAREFYHEDPSHIDRVLAMVQGKAAKAQLTPDEVVFYHCRNLGPNRQCQVYEDRPSFCRDYPASPTSLLVKGCGYEAWQQQCQQVLRQLGYEVVGLP